MIFFLCFVPIWGNFVSYLRAGGFFPNFSPFFGLFSFFPQFLFFTGNPNKILEFSAEFLGSFGASLGLPNPQFFFVSISPPADHNTSLITPKGVCVLLQGQPCLLPPTARICLRRDHPHHRGLTRPQRMQWLLCSHADGQPGDVVTGDRATSWAAWAVSRGFTLGLGMNTPRG